MIEKLNCRPERREGEMGHTTLPRGPGSSNRSEDREAERRSGSSSIRSSQAGGDNNPANTVHKFPAALLIPRPKSTPPALSPCSMRPKSASFLYCYHVRLDVNLAIFAITCWLTGRSAPLDIVTFCAAINHVCCRRSNSNIANYDAQGSRGAQLYSGLPGCCNVIITGSKILG